jgi:hypothetical protein
MDNPEPSVALSYTQGSSKRMVNNRLMQKAPENPGPRTAYSNLERETQISPRPPQDAFLADRRNRRYTTGLG